MGPLLGRRPLGDSLPPPSNHEPALTAIELAVIEYGGDGSMIATRATQALGIEIPSSLPGWVAAGDPVRTLSAYGRRRLLGPSC
jgi:hypothetical protein